MRDAAHGVNKHTRLFLLGQHGLSGCLCLALVNNLEFIFLQAEFLIQDLVLG